MIGLKLTKKKIKVASWLLDAFTNYAPLQIRLNFMK